MDEQPDYAGIAARAARGQYMVADYAAIVRNVKAGHQAEEAAREAWRPPPPLPPYDRFHKQDEDGYWQLSVPPLPRDEVLAVLRAMTTDKAMWDDPENNHTIADALLLHLLNDPEISAAFDAISKWYS